VESECPTCQLTLQCQVPVRDHSPCLSVGMASMVNMTTEVPIMPVAAASMVPIHTTASARPPGTARNNRCRVINRSPASQVFSMIMPIKMNIGAATRTPFSIVPEKIRLGKKVACTTHLSPVHSARSPKIRLMPISITATGAPENSAGIRHRNMALGRTEEIDSMMRCSLSRLVTRDLAAWRYYAT